MAHGTRSRGPTFKHDILSTPHSSPSPSPSPAPSPSTSHEARARRKKSGDRAGHRIECTKPGRARSNTGKKYLRPEDREAILKDDPTCSITSDCTNIVHCDACGDDTKLESGGFPLTSWLNHCRTSKHKSNARRHLSDANYAEWERWFEEHVTKKSANFIRSTSLASSTHSTTPTGTPPTIAFPVALPPPLSDVEWLRASPRHHSLPRVHDSQDDESHRHASSSLSSFRLRPALWSGAPESAPGNTQLAARDMSLSRSL